MQPSSHSGFSLVELLVVLAIVGMAAGVMAPAVGATFDATRIERAERDVEAIARAIVSCKDSVGDWPAMNASGNPAGVAFLLSGAVLPASSPWVSSSTWWTRISGSRDLLLNHLALNRPQGQTNNRYPASGVTKWRGPFLDSVPLDPWGRPYVVNIVAGSSTSGTQDQRMWVISAGPDGQFQTSVNASRTDLVLGDDIAALALQR